MDSVVLRQVAAVQVVQLTERRELLPVAVVQAVTRPLRDPLELERLAGSCSRIKRLPQAGRSVELSGEECPEESSVTWWVKR